MICRSSRRIEKKKNVDRLEDKSLESYAKAFVQDTMNLSKSYQSTFIPLKKYEATEIKENFKVEG